MLLIVNVGQALYRYQHTVLNDDCLNLITVRPQAAGMLTLDGHCKTLDSSADGYARAEACVVMLLTAPDVTRSGKMGAASAVMLCSTFVNQDGRSSSLTAPNGPSQQQV